MRGRTDGQSEVFHTFQVEDPVPAQHPLRSVKQRADGVLKGMSRRFCGATVTTGNAYPGWDPNPDSPTLAVARRVYKELFGKDPKVLAIHAGLECGIIGKLVGNMDMVSLGPTIRGAHSPDERVYVDSVDRTWRYLTRLLAELATEGK